MTEDAERIIRARIDEWRRRLIDLSYRNRLIKYRPTRASTIEIESPDLEILLRDLGRTAPWRFYFPPEPEEQEEQLSSPLVLIPIELRRESAGHPYALYFVDDEEIVVNPSLTEKLRR